MYESKTTLPANTPNDNDTNKLQFTGHEEGRIRALYDNSAVPNTITGFAYDYMIKDHLGNVRMVLTEELKPDIYPAATLENNNTPLTDPLAIEMKYYTINTVNIVRNLAAAGITAYQNHNGNPPTNNSSPIPVNNNPNCTATTPIKFTDLSDKLYKINGNDAKKTGLDITLKVMSGDKVNILGKSYYFENTVAPTSPNLPLNNIINALLGTPTGTTIGKAVAADLTANATGFATVVNSFITKNNTSTPAGRPRAFINYILLDEQFNYITAYASPVNTVGGTVKSHWDADPQLQNIAVTKNGYIYVYCSNKSPVNVFFDNLQVTHTRGPILEETHYYPFGLTMSGISSSSAAGKLENKIKFQEQELASKEFSDGSGLEMYEFKCRMHDPQTGRFWQIDPLAEKYVYNSTYAFSENKVTGHRELEGLEAWAVNPNGNGGLSATVTNINAPFSVTQGGATTGYFPNADMNRQLGGAMVSQGSLLVPTNANGDYNSYSGEGIQNFNYNTPNLAATPTMTTNVITNGTPVVLPGNRNATDPMATVGATTLATPAITSATAPGVNLTYSDQAGLPNTFTVTNNSKGANVMAPVSGNGTATGTATGFVSGGTISVTTTEQPRQRGDGYNYSLTVTPTVSTPTTTPTPAATANQLRIVQGQSRSLLNNVALPNN